CGYLRYRFSDGGGEKAKAAGRFYRKFIRSHVQIHQFGDAFRAYWGGSSDGLYGWTPWSRHPEKPLYAFGNALPCPDYVLIGGSIASSLILKSSYKTIC